MGNIVLKVVRSGDKDFYNLVGPFLGRRDIYNETGYPIFVDESKEFIVAIDNKPVAISARDRKAGKTVLCNFFVEKEYRGQGLFTLLLDACLEGENGEIEVMAAKGTGNEYLKRGFAIVRETKNYTYLRREAR